MKNVICCAGVIGIYEYKGFGLKSFYERLEFHQLSCAREVKLLGGEFGRWFDV